MGSEISGPIPARVFVVDLGKILAPAYSLAKKNFDAHDGIKVSTLPNDLLLLLLIHQLRQLDLDIELACKPDPTYIDQWKAAVRMPGIYQRWLEHTLRILRTEAGNSALFRARSGSEKNPWRDWDQLKRSLSPGLSSHAKLVETALRAIPEILTGTRPAISVFFPGGSFNLMEAVYTGNPVSDYFNELTAQSLLAYVQARVSADPTARVRILEVGAGTGATTTHVLRRLAPLQDKIEEYCFTDLSTAFLTQARRRYTPLGARYMRYKLFDIEKRPEEQAVETHSYDAIVAVNVLHATEDIRRTLRNVKSCLKQHGMLLLNELSSNDLFSHLAYSLLEGWWRFKDESERMLGSPALAPEQWQRVLSSEGFRDIQFPAFSEHSLGQQIVAALSDLGGGGRAPKAIDDTGSLP